MELECTLPVNATYPGLLQNQVVVAPGNSQPPFHPYRHFSQQGRKRGVNAIGRYDCEVCWKDYASTQSLRNHQRKKHKRTATYTLYGSTR